MNIDTFIYSSPIYIFCCIFIYKHPPLVLPILVVLMMICFSKKSRYVTVVSFCVKFILVTRMISLMYPFASGNCKAALDVQKPFTVIEVKIHTETFWSRLVYERSKIYLHDNRKWNFNFLI